MLFIIYLLVANPPTNLEVAYDGLTSTVSWSPDPGPEEYPVTGYQIDYQLVEVSTVNMVQHAFKNLAKQFDIPERKIPGDFMLC